MNDKSAIITVDHDVLESLDQLFYTGAKGTHLLFSTRAIRDAFDRLEGIDADTLETAVERLHPVLNDLLDRVDLDDQRDFIEHLDPAVRDLLVHLYFGFLDRYLTEDEPPEILH